MTTALGPSGGQGAQSVEHGALARIPAGHGRGKLAMTGADRPVIERPVAGADDHQDVVDAGMPQEQRQRPRQNRRPADQRILLRQGRAGAHAAAGGNDQGGGCHMRLAGLRGCAS